MKTFNQYIKEKIDPYKSHNLRMKKGYKPKYRQGLIAVHFQDEENKKSRNYRDIDNDEYFINYQYLMGDKSSDFRNYFQDKYNIKLSNYRPDDEYFYYFTCEPGKEKETMEKLANDKRVKDVDFVDIRELDTDELRDIAREIERIADDYTNVKNDISKKSIADIIEKLKKLI